ncbi:hypothetical protein [Flyfo siphovirus Tbat2_3]|nr:hypothetical protein [Flyfo siphovirus Tbat2_3]
MGIQSTQRQQFRDEMANIVAYHHEINPESVSVVANWKDWDDMFNAGYRKDNAGEAYFEWLRCS